MTKGELKKVALALYKMTEVEEKVNDIVVWDAIGEDGIKVVGDIQAAMFELTEVISGHLRHAEALRTSVRLKEYDVVTESESIRG